LTMAVKVVHVSDVSDAEGSQEGLGTWRCLSTPPCAGRVYIHQLPQTASRVAGLIEGVFGPAASAERRGERHWSDTRPRNRA
jgi:hypothetical protein